MRLIIVGLLILSYIFCSGSSAADLPKKITCSGKVVDDANKPVAGAKVTLYRLTPDTRGQELKKAASEEERITGEDGGFSFSAEATGNKQYQFGILVARKEGLAIGWDNWEMRQDNTAELTMSKPYSLRGIVVDEAGKGVGGAEVRISILFIGNPQSRPEKMRYLMSVEPLELLVTTTDKKGNFVFNNIPMEAKAEFVIKKAGLATVSTLKPPQSMNSAKDYNPGQYTVESRDIRIVLTAEARIEGKVIEKGTGKAIGGVRLFCATQPAGGALGVKAVVSKDDGTFGFEGLGAKTYTIRGVASGEKIAEWIIKPETVTATAGKINSGIIIEASKGGILEVTVRDDEKKPVAGANVFVRMNDSDMQGASGRTSSGGAAAIRLSPGEYTVGVYKEGFPPLREQKTVTVEDGKTIRLEIELKANPKITGIVRDPNGRPVAGAAVRICPTGQKEAISDKEGKFEITWNPEQRGIGEPTLVLVARHAGQNLAAAVDIDEDTKTIDVKMSPGIIFTGNVVDPNGKPVAGAKVDVSLRVSNYGASFGNDNVVTDKDGKYEYKAIAEGQKYSVSVRADGYGQSYTQADADDAENNRLEIAALTLKEAALSISGTVVDGNDKPMANTEVFVYGDGQQQHFSKTDAQGKFTVDKLCEGELHINANVQNRGAGTIPMYGNVNAKAGDMDVKVVVKSPEQSGEMPGRTNQPTGTLEVVIIDDANEAVAGANVSVRVKEGNRWHNGVSDENGIALLKLVPGKYDLWEIRKEGYSFTREQKAVTIEVGKTVQLEVELKANPRIKGIVRDPNGQPVAHAAMRIFPLGQMGRDTDKDGRFEIFWNPEQWGNREPQPVLVIRQTRKNLAAAVDINENTKTIDVNLSPGIVFTGMVVDANNEVIAGAKVTVSLIISGHAMRIDNTDAITDQNGQYEYKAIAAGREYSVSAKAEGYGGSYVEVDADKAVNNHLEITTLTLKEAPLSISGIVVDVNDKPVAKAEVTINGQGQQYHRSLTDANGNFTIDKLCEGKVQIHASLNNDGVFFQGDASASAGDMDVTVMVASPNAERRPLNRIDPGQFEQARKTLATLAQCPNKDELEAAIDKAKAAVDRFGGGHVIVGRVVLDGQGDVRYVDAQMEILTDGYFAGETKDLIGPVGFRMHGYAPYDLKLKGMKGDLIDVGTIHLTALKEDELASLKGEVILEENGDASQAVLHMGARNGPINTPHNGTSPRRHWPQPVEIHADKNGLVEASGFSPIEYWCTVTAPGYLRKTITAEFSAGRTFDLGTVTLEIPRQIQLTYIVSEQPPFDLKNLQTVSIPAGTQWKAVESERPYGWDLEFGQDKASITMMNSYGPCFLRDLGKGEIADYVNVEKEKVGYEPPHNIKAKNEHVYLLHQQYFKRWVLFKIIIE